VSSRLVVGGAPLDGSPRTEPEQSPQLVHATVSRTACRTSARLYMLLAGVPQGITLRCRLLHLLGWSATWKARRDCAW
jgi:hypothetical protein